MDMFISQYDSGLMRFFTDEQKEEYLDDDAREHTSQIFFKEKLKPANGWAVPFVTGHKYHIHWGIGLDFERMYVTLSDRWTADDNVINFHTNYTDVRETFNITDTSTGELLEDDSYIGKYAQDLEFGDNIQSLIEVDGDEDTKEKFLEFHVNAKVEGRN